MAKGLRIGVAHSTADVVITPYGNAEFDIVVPLPSGAEGFGGWLNGNAVKLTSMGPGPSGWRMAGTATGSVGSTVSIDANASYVQSD